MAGIFWKSVARFCAANFTAIAGWMLSYVRWDTLSAHAMQWLLNRAIDSGVYLRVRNVAQHLIEQGQLILKVTDDRVVTKDEAGQVADSAMSLLSAWYNKEAKPVTEAKVAEVDKAIDSVKKE